LGLEFCSWQLIVIVRIQKALFRRRKIVEKVTVM